MIITQHKCGEGSQRRCRQWHYHRKSAEPVFVGLRLDEGIYREGDKARMPGMFKELKLKRESPVTCLERTSSATLLSLTLNKLLGGLQQEKDVLRAALQEDELSHQAENRWEERNTGARDRRTFQRRQQRHFQQALGAGEQGARVKSAPEVIFTGFGNGWLWRGRRRGSRKLTQSYEADREGWIPQIQEEPVTRRFRLLGEGGNEGHFEMLGQEAWAQRGDRHEEARVSR